MPSLVNEVDVYVLSPDMAADITQVLDRYSNTPISVYWLRGPEHTRSMSYSVSRCPDGFTIVAVNCAGRVGIDWEPLDRELDFDALVRWYFTRREADCIRRSEEPYGHATLRHWTRKEAFVKALGIGMSARFKSFEVISESHGRWSVRRRAGPRTGWHTTDFVIGNRVGSVALYTLDRGREESRLWPTIMRKSRRL